MSAEFDVDTANLAARELLPHKLIINGTFPELDYFSTLIKPSVSFNLPQITPDGSSGGFRNLNEGVYQKHANVGLSPVQCGLFDASWGVDIATQQVYDGGADIFSIEADQSMQSSIAKLCRQIWHGKTADTSGFLGFDQLFNANSNISGSTGQYLIYGVKDGTLGQQIVWGNGGRFLVSPFAYNENTDTDGKRYTRVTQSVTGVTALAMWNPAAAGRLQTDSLTDEVIYNWLAGFRIGFEPSALFMSLPTLNAIRASRQAFNPAGSPVQAPTGISGFFGNIPIYITSALDPSFSFDIAAAPTTPTVSASAAGATAITLNWTINSNPTGVVLQRGTTASGPWTPIAVPPKAATSGTFTDTGLTAATHYYYRLALVNSAGTSGLGAADATTPAT